MILAIDFDRTIHNIDEPLDGQKMGKPMPGAEQALEAIQDSGHNIIIHTLRARSPQGTEVVQDWLDYYDLPYSSITAIKPDADYYIDDKALTFLSWNDTLIRLGVDLDV
ncbi:MAG: hypothetical protein NVS1B10_06190 [Candidatus Saccharimonadales bacterium]